MAPSLCFSILVLLTFGQFILIMNLISINHHNQQISSNTVSVKLSSKYTDEIPSIATESKNPYVPIINITKPIDGVAVTAFLDSPKWYARRYSIMIQNIANNLPDNWKIQIFHTGRGGSQVSFDINPGIDRFIENGLVTLTLLPKEMQRMRRMHIMLHKWFWENILADKVLVFGGGAVFCSNSPYSVNDFLKYDYIGSPWGNIKGIGGEGGTSIQAMSIRNRQHMLQALTYALDKIDDPQTKLTAFKEWGSEDHFFISTLLEMKKKNLIVTNIAPKEATYEFAAIGSYANESVLVATGTLPEVDFMIRDKFLQYCPEMKVMYPSLHDPSCFGASPNGEECAKSICALKPREERPSGC